RRRLSRRHARRARARRDEPRHRAHLRADRLRRHARVAAAHAVGCAAVGVGCFVSTGRSLDAAVERVKLAEELGYESVYLTHIAGREPFIVLSAYALATQRIRL